MSRTSATAAEVDRRLADFDALGATRAISRLIDELSTWYLRRSRKRFARGGGRDAASAFATLHATLLTIARIVGPILPFLAEAIYQNLIERSADERDPESVHLTEFPKPAAADRDEALEASMAVAMRAVELVRTLRAQAGLRTRQPIATLWLALPGGEIAEREALLSLVADEVNVKAIELIGDESELVERRVKVLLPRVGKRLGPRIPEVMAAARDGRFVLLPDGSVELAGVTLAADEVEIQASPRPGTAVAHDQGLVAVIDTTLTPELRAEGDARELQRAIQDLRREAGLELDDRIALWVGSVPAEVSAHVKAVAAETLAELAPGEPPADVQHRATVELDSGPVVIALRRQAVGA